MLTPLAFFLIALQSTPATPTPPALDPHEERERRAQQRRELERQKYGDREPELTRGPDGLWVRVGPGYAAIPLPEVPTLPRWLDIARLAGVPVDRPEVVEVLRACCDRNRDECFARRDREYRSSDAEISGPGESPQGVPLATLKLLAQVMEELPREVRSDSEALKQAIYAAAGAVPDAPPLDAERVQRAVALSERRALRRCLLSGSVYRANPSYYIDLEDDKDVQALMWTPDEPMRSFLLDYERRTAAELMRFAEVLRAHRKMRVEQFGTEQVRSMKVVDALRRIWDQEAAAYTTLPLPDAALRVRLQHEFRIREHEASSHVYLAKLRLGLFEEPPEKRARECLEAVKSAVDVAERAMYAAWRDRWMSVWAGNNPIDSVDIARYQARMRNASSALGDSVRAAIALDDPSPPGAGLKTPDGRDLLWALQPIGERGADGIWKLRDLGTSWPGDMPGPVLLDARP